MGAKLAHDLTLRATRWSGTLNVDDSPAGCNASLSVDPRSIEIVEARGGVKSLSDKDRRDIDKNINEKVLESGKYPELKFESSSCSGAAPNFKAAGNMTIKGTTRPVNIDINVNGTTVTARTSISQKDFDIKPFSAMMGAIKLRDDVDFEVTVNLPSA
ncbi:MAG TPA: YceI family protein [Acidimicrobiales bacterium]|nr:YceI family protein [Acidimicrobiales bacterium]